jgi:ATP-binding cassette, subfamily F, member 3
VELQRIDERMAKLNAEKAEIEKQLAKPAAGGDDYAELGRRLAHASAEIHVLEERWLQVQTELESLTPPA